MLATLKEKLFALFRPRRVRAILALLFGLCVVFFDARSIDSAWARVLVGSFFGASIASLAFRDSTNTLVSKIAAVGFAFFAIVGYSIFTLFSQSAQFSSWIVMVSLAIFTAYVMCRD
jgi:hypothetical protein